jgi:hypothetical protein
MLTSSPRLWRRLPSSGGPFPNEARRQLRLPPWVLARQLLGQLGHKRLDAQAEKEPAAHALAAPGFIVLDVERLVANAGEGISISLHYIPIAALYAAHEV